MLTNTTWIDISVRCNSSVGWCRLCFQSILTNSTLLRISVLCSSRACWSCCVSAALLGCALVSISALCWLYANLGYCYVLSCTNKMQGVLRNKWTRCYPLLGLDLLCFDIFFNVLDLALYCFALRCFALLCFALLCIALHCIALHCLTLHCIALLWTTCCKFSNCPSWRREILKHKGSSRQMSFHTLVMHQSDK